MKTQKIILASLVSAIIFFSCTKEVDIALKTTDPKIVIEGNITNEPGPYTVQIRKSVNFSDPNQFPAITGATVMISDNTGASETLSETSAGIYQTKTLVGVPGRVYTLKVVADGKNFSATSTMPQMVNLDGVEFDLSSSKGNSGGPEYSTLPVFTDPTANGNSYRFLQTVNGKPDKTYFVLNDNTFNGLKNEQLLFNPDAEIKSGDSVTLEFRCIDKSTYDYFYTLSQFNTDGPYNTTPTNPPNNIKGDVAYGIFSAYTVQTMSAVVPGK